MFYVILAYLTYPFVYIVSRFFARHNEGSILVFQTAKIGDMICTTPVFREIKKARPSARLGVVVDPVTAPLLRHNPHVDEVIELEPKGRKGLLNKIALARSLYAKRYSSAIILAPNAVNLVAAFWAMIPRRVAVYPDYSGRTVRFLLGLSTDRVYHLSPRPAMETYLRCLEPFGVKDWDLKKEAYSPPGVALPAFLKDGRSVVGVALGTGNAMKDWGKQNFTWLARMILERTDSTVALLGSKKEAPIGDEIITLIGEGPRLYNLCGAFGLDEMPEVMKGMRLVVGVDTGLVYMADALGVPVVDIAGPSNVEDQRPMGEKAVVVQDRTLECVPCSHTFFTPYECRLKHINCVANITARRVFRSVAAILAGENAIRQI